MWGRFLCRLRFFLCAMVGHIGPNIFTAGHTFCTRCANDLNKYFPLPPDEN